jgi:hypothetical protein
MFGSGFDPGFAIADVQAQITGFLGNAVVAGLVGAGLALAVVPRIIRVIKGTIRG